MDKKTIAIIIMGLIILGGVLVVAYNRIYNSGFQAGTENFYNQLIITLSQNNGEVVLPLVINNQTQQIKLRIVT